MIPPDPPLLPLNGSSGWNCPPIDASPYQMFIDEVDAFCAKTGSSQAMDALVMLMQGGAIYQVQLEEGDSVVRIYPSVAARMVFAQFEKKISTVN